MAGWQTSVSTKDSAFKPNLETSPDSAVDYLNNSLTLDLSHEHTSLVDQDTSLTGLCRCRVGRCRKETKFMILRNTVSGQYFVNPKTMKEVSLHELRFQGFGGPIVAHNHANFEV